MYIYNPVKLFWLLTLITCFNVGIIIEPLHLIFSLSFHVPLQKLAMVLLQIKPKIMVLVAMDGKHKLTMVLLLIIVYKEVLKGSYDAISRFPSLWSVTSCLFIDEIPKVFKHLSLKSKEIFFIKVKTRPRPPKMTQ